jgi:malate synthase
MSDRIQQGGLNVDAGLHSLLEQEILPGTGVQPDQFWNGLEKILADFTPRNRELLDIRARMQAEIDAWHRERRGQALDPDEYRAFLESTGYLLPEVDDFAITTENVDEEVSMVAGPQLVVPVMNARYALNAANARWGSLYDALYGTDVIPETEGAERGPGYNEVRGARVIDYVRRFLDDAVPLATGSYSDATALHIDDGQLWVKLDDGATTRLADEHQLRGYLGESASPTSVLLRHNGLHIDIQIDPASAVGRTDRAGISDVILEAAVTTIQDCEDSVAAVDGEDKVVVYRNWLGLMRGDLTDSFEKAGSTVRRSLNPDRSYTARDGGELVMHGRSLLFVRNVGHLMTTDAILDAGGNEVPEGILDGLFTSAIALHDLRVNKPLCNSRAGSVYIVKPKMHGPEEVAFTCSLFARIEDVLGMARNTLKLGIMDEERRTTINLKACIHEATTAVDQRLRGLERGHRPALRAAGQGPDRQGHVGNAGPHGRHDGAESRPSAVRRQHCLGALTHCRYTARHALPRRRCRRTPTATQDTRSGVTGRHPDDSGSRQPVFQRS